MSLLINKYSKLLYNVLLFIGVYVLVILYWRLRNSFFYWDEWTFLRDITYHMYSIWDAHNEHFFPLFKSFYFIEFKLFGLNAHYYQYVNLLLHTINIFLIYYLSNLIFNNRWTSIVAGVFYAFNPMQSENLIWTFQSNILLNIMFFLLGLIFITKYIQNQKKYYILLGLIFTFLQNYFFGTGLFLPLVALIYFIILGRDRKYVKYYITILAIFIFNLGVYKITSADQVSQLAKGFKLSDYIPIIDYYLYAITNSVSRIFILLAKPSSGMVLTVYSIILCGCTAFYQKDRSTNKRILLITLYGSLIFWIPITLSRYKFGVEQSLASRYVSYTLIFSAFMIMYIINNYQKKIKHKNRLAVVLGLLLIVYLSQSYRISRVHIAEQEAINKYNYSQAIKYIKDRNYPADFSKLHPLRTKDEIYKIMTGK